MRTSRAAVWARRFSEMAHASSGNDDQADEALRLKCHVACPACPSRSDLRATASRPAMRACSSAGVCVGASATRLGRKTTDIRYLAGIGGCRDRRSNSAIHAGCRRHWSPHRRRMAHPRHRSHRHHRADAALPRRAGGHRLAVPRLRLPGAPGGARRPGPHPLRPARLRRRHGGAGPRPRIRRSTGLMVPAGRDGRAGDADLLRLCRGRRGAGCAGALAAGAMPLCGRGAVGPREVCSFRDPEGHIWNFGALQPRPAARPHRAALPAGARRLPARPVRSRPRCWPACWRWRSPPPRRSAGPTVRPRISPASGLRRRGIPTPEVHVLDQRSRRARRAASGRSRGRGTPRCRRAPAARARSAQAAAELATRRAHERVVGGERTADEARQRAAGGAGRARCRRAGTRRGRARSLRASAVAREAAELATKEALTRKPKSWRLKKVESAWAW